MIVVLDILRYAIDYANSNPGIDTIDLTGISGTINLNSTLNIGAGNDINFVDDGNTTISGTKRTADF
ncbi:MAG UNVERIFIED_CONTAM: hypothetical protein LVR29_21610 [Microcystis novacekii LVE1205-3]|jgi:hypothetical protein